MKAHSRMLGGVSLAIAVLAGGTPTLAQDDPHGLNPRLGGPSGRLRNRITRGAWELVEAPDVITLKDGRRHEAYWLNVYGDRLVYYVKETERSWLREEIARPDVASIEFQQYLEKDPLAPARIVPARKQPAPKADILAGVFTASAGRQIRWTVSFQTELDKLVEAAEDATDYGTVEIESSSVQQVEGDLPPVVLPRGNTRGGKDLTVVWPRKDFTRSHQVRVTGKYHLYAPGSVGNDDWVLSLTELIQTEIDHGRETSLLTTAMPVETFILYFSPDRRSFRLAWSNLGSWTWTSLVGVDFHRFEGSRLDPDYLRLPPRTPLLEPPSSLPRDRDRQLFTSEESPILTAARAPAPAKRWGINGWKRPPSRWR